MLVKGIDQGFSGSDVKQGVIEGYFAIFDSKDSDGDIIERGSFAKTIQERGPKGKQLIKYLLDHDTKKVVAKINELHEDHKGLRYVAKIGTHAAGQDFQKMIESELINQHSFGYKTIKSQYDNQSKANRLKELMMVEGSAIQFLAANSETTFIDLKSFEDALEYFEKLERFVRNSNATDETLKQLETKMKSLSDYIAGSTTIEEKKADSDKINIESLTFSFESWKN